MTEKSLLITVRLPGERYHGTPEWPPSPFRLFQALMAGAFMGAPMARAVALAPAFDWLEGLGPPTIAAPPARRSRRSTLWVPNNDIDTVGGDPKQIAKLRTAKHVQPWLISDEGLFVYLWRVDEDDRGHAQTIVEIAERLYRFGRGIDMAYATAEILSDTEAETRLAAHVGGIHRPSDRGEGGNPLRCPVAGSFESLCVRHRAQRARLSRGDLRQAPQPRFRMATYDSVPARSLFDLVRGDGVTGFQPVAQTGACSLVEEVRDAVVRLLSRSADARLVERIVVGRSATEADKARRLRIVPLPSIGFEHADRAIRRLLVEVPTDCPIPAREIEWAAGTVHLGVDRHGEIIDETAPQLVRATDDAMLEHYGITAGDSHRERSAYRVWRTVTPAALPERAARRRISPARVRIRAEQKAGVERAAEESGAAAAVRDTLRHAGIDSPVTSVWVQREPFDRKGARAEAFAAGTRFAKGRLWHVEIAFAHAVLGPVVIGDGRYLGLGVMAPVRDASRDVLVSRLPARPIIAANEGAAFVRAVRRALMALSRDERGRVPALFSGHEADGGPARRGRHRHVFLAAEESDAEKRIDRLVVAAPWICDRTADRVDRSQRTLFDRVVSSLQEVHTGRLGVVTLGPMEAPSSGDPLMGPARVWETRTPYRPTRHAARRKEPAAAVVRDLITECRRRGLPSPAVDLLEFSLGPKGGNVVARARLTFGVAVNGPILLGRDSHLGGGLFAGK